MDNTSSWSLILQIYKSTTTTTSRTSRRKPTTASQAKETLSWYSGQLVKDQDGPQHQTPEPSCQTDDGRECKDLDERKTVIVYIVTIIGNDY